MAQILVRNLDESVVKQLKKRAEQDGRSLQSEAKMILEQAANDTHADMETARKLIYKIRNRIKGRKFPDSVKLIREARAR